MATQQNLMSREKMSQTIAVLLTCYNRVKKTLLCLDALFAQTIPPGAGLSVFLVDDGSTDCTGDTVRDRFPQVQVINGDGSLFWNRGMHLAFGEALKDGFDHYLWLNDDITLREGAIENLLRTHRGLMLKGMEDSIIIASTRDPNTGEFNYGGYTQSGRINPLKLTLRPPADKPVRCDTFCGNCVLIPRSVVERVGNIDPVYKHRWGDVDYGLRAKKLGCEIWAAPGYLGDCESNPMADRWRDSQHALRDRVKELHSVKGLGKKDWWIFVRRHGGPLWLLSGIKPYLRILFDAVGLKGFCLRTNEANERRQN